MNKEESPEEIIREEYLRILKRPPDETGFEFYLEQLKSKRITKTGLQNLLKNSREYLELQWPKKISQSCDQFEKQIISFVSPYTQTRPQSVLALISSVKYIVRNNIPGSIVECGVWKGGSMMAVAKILLYLNTERELYLFDTFTGMTKPDEIDVTFSGNLRAIDEYKNNSQWFGMQFVPLEDVKNAMQITEYNMKKIHFVKGDVKNTLPEYAPASISLLRLDTDFYESTYNEISCLFPKLEKGGIIIIDDYDLFQGQRKAVDEYFEQNHVDMILHHTGGGSRFGIKE